MLLRLFFSAVFSSFQFFHRGVSSSDTMFKKTLSNKDALCNDGSPAVYFLGVQNTSKWIIFLESGAYCLTKAQCLARFGNEYTKVLMTSQHMPDSIKGRDLLSTSREKNGLFYDFSRVLIPYCSSDAFLGTETKASSFENNSSADDFVFSGKIIFQSVIFDLLMQGLDHAREIVLIGSSAGAVGAYNQIQWLQDLLSSKNLEVNLSAIIDGGWFINFQDSIASKITEEFYSVGKPLSRACADVTDGYPCCLSVSCMLTRGYYPSNVSTFFVFSMFDIYIIGDSVERFSKRVNVAENGATDLITLVDLYGGAMNHSLVAIKSSNFSYFVPACFQHTFFSMSSLRDQDGLLHYTRMFSQGNAIFGMTKRPGTWLSTAIRRGHGTISLHSTLHKWAKTRDQPVRVTDSCLGAMCNPTCPEMLKFVDTATDWGEVLNGVVLCMSLLITVACVVLKICFVSQFALLKRSRRHYIEDHIKYSQVSVYEADEAITLLYSSQEDPKRPQSYNDVQETAKDHVEEHSRRNEDPLSEEYTAKGYNTIFYRTVQYLRMVFRQKHRVDDVEKIKTHADRVESEERSEKLKISHPKQRINQDVMDKRKAFYARGIHNVTLSFKQGEFTAIVGKQGGGKTTLLKILSGRLMCRCNKEHVCVNSIGPNESRASYASKTVFLSKFVLPYYGEITVRNYLILAAFMRMSRTADMATKFERVEQIISELNLTSVADTTLRGSWKKNSELQKRLLCLALQVIARPLAIFLDEPITGLDSVSSMEMLNVLRGLCDNGHLVIITTQALPGKTAELFNQLVLLSDKQVLYDGEPSRLSECYSFVTDEIEKPTELEDILENKRLKDAMIERRQFEPAVKDAVRSNTREKHILPGSHNRLNHAGLLTRLFVIDYRASLSSSLGQVVYLPIMFSVFGLTAGIVYWQAETHLQIITAYCGASIPSLLFISSVVLNRINKSLEISRLESALDVGYSHEHVIHTFLSTSAACLLPVIANSVQTYFMVMTSYNWWRFVLVTVISLVLNQTWIAVYMMVTYATPSNACHAGLVVAILAGFSGGFIVTRGQMPFGYNLLFYINPQFYGYAAITKVLLRDVHLNCEFEAKLNCISTDGNAVLARFDFDSVNPYGHLVVMLCFTVLCLLFSWVLCDARTSR